MSKRATFVAADCQFPPNGTKGTAVAASGFSDPESAEYGAYVFAPDDEEAAYYCDPVTDLVFDGTEGVS
jgi:hypothetical protein